MMCRIKKSIIESGKLNAVGKAFAVEVAHIQR